MTLIYTQFSKLGIILAADSNLTSSSGSTAVGDKGFEVPYLKAGLCVAGSYSGFVQLAGYVRDAAGYHPEFYFIRNIEDNLNPNDGSYHKGPTFKVDEQLWGRDLKEQEPRGNFLAGNTAHLYVNGYPAGRIAYMTLMDQLGAFLNSTWDNPGWKFRRPKTLSEQVDWINLQFQVIDTLFRSSDYPSQYIGGPVWTLGIPPP